MQCTRIVLSLLWIVAIALQAARGAPQSDEPIATDPVVTKLDQRVMRFLDGISDGKESDAFAELLVGSQLLDQVPAVRALVDKSKEIAQRYGAHRESEQIGVKRVGKDVVLMKYLFKCEKFPVVWYIAFYRDFSRPAVAGDDHWVVISVRFDTQVERLFE